MRVLDYTSSVRGLPLGRSVVLATMALLLTVADVFPDNHYIDADYLESWLAICLGVSAVVLAARDRRIEIDWVAWRNRVILLAITIGLCMASAEAATRFVFRSITTSSDNGGYFSRRWYRVGDVRHNSWGYRDREFDPVKPQGVYRIAAVGDSFTFGNGIREEERYSEVLQSHLPSHFEVLNFGVPGANTPEHRVMVQRLLGAIHPDFILLQWYVNDVEDDDATGRPRPKALIPYQPLHNWLNDASALYTIANMQWAESQVSLGVMQSYPDYLRSRLGDPESVDSIRDLSLLRDLVASAQRAHVGIGIVLFPDTASDLGANYPFGYLHDRVLSVCAERGITCVDLRSDFAAIRERQSLWANRLDHHPSARANAIAAEKILQTYSALWAQ